MAISCDSSGDERYMTNRVFLTYFLKCRKEPLGYCDPHLLRSFQQGRRQRNFVLFWRNILIALKRLGCKSINKMSGKVR